MTAAAVRERDEAKREQMYMDLQKKVLDEGPFIIMFQTIIAACRARQREGLRHGPVADVVYYNLTTK